MLRYWYYCTSGLRILDQNFMQALLLASAAPEAAKAADSIDEALHPWQLGSNEQSQTWVLCSGVPWEVTFQCAAWGLAYRRTTEGCFTSYCWWCRCLPGVIMWVMSSSAIQTYDGFKCFLWMFGGTTIWGGWSGSGTPMCMSVPPLYGWVLCLGCWVHKNLCGTMISVLRSFEIKVLILQILMVCPHGGGFPPLRLQVWCC